MRKVKAVWKYKLEIEAIQMLELPYGSLYLSCGSQRSAKARLHPEVSEDIVLWFLVNPYTELKEKWQAFVVGTGQEIGEEVLRVGFFAGTVLMMDGALVWHIWLRKLD